MERKADQSRRRIPKVLLDSNIWRYVLDAGAQGALLRAANNNSVTVQVAPAVVYEALRLRDVPQHRTSSI